MNAREKILNFLKVRGSDGVMQSEICLALRLSKSTVSEILKELEAKEEIVKEKIGRAYRIWHADFAPFPVKRIRIGILRAAEYPHVLLAAKKLNARIIVFENALKLTKALASGSIDVGFFSTHNSGSLWIVAKIH
jgi:predicted transcriptional regulator